MIRSLLDFWSWSGAHTLLSRFRSAGFFKGYVLEVRALDLPASRSKPVFFRLQIGSCRG